ncbi:transferrin-binding protein-like solute binding protein [Neisseria meningitidis]|uniref:transferrin-binding protein-like solute binding protein n=1 Tax=Neisseria meningitidis TaxID=487 RepID=UPI0007665AE8|nr:transferrin-binding protein-like solute binding protein [Neisseria meningitidis]CWO47756.1 protein Ex13L [Neisseria meningitidis]CWP11525.1 protein Ex13L [Neisseria meningitidis]CWS35230.1 protein Ex13L [Neisseria meningitidis]
MRLRSNPRKHRQIKLPPPPTDTGNPATGADTASPSAGTDGGAQNDAPQHNDNAPASSTSDTQPENNRDMPVSDAGRADGGNQDTDAPKNAESQDGTEGNAVSEGTGMPANPSSEKTEHTEVAMNTEGANPPSEAENSEGAGQGGMQADDGRQDAEGGLQGDDPAAHSPQDQDQQPQNAADNQPKTGVFGEKYFDGKGEITALMIGGETIDLTKANEPVSRNHPGLMSDFDKVMVSQNQYKNLIYGAVKLKDGSYTLFVQGQPTEALPEGKAKYQGKVLHFRSRNVTDKTDWLDEGSSYRTTGTFTAEVDFGQKSVNGTINSGDGVYMGTKKFTATIEGSGFKGGWNTKEQGDVEGKFYGSNGDEMAGRYSFNKTPDKNDGFSDNGFGVFAGKKEANVR